MGHRHASAQPSAACRATLSCAAPLSSSRGARTPAWRLLAAVAALMVVATQLSPAAAQCDTTPGVTLTARHYTQDLTEMPDWSDTSNVDASVTTTAADPSWPVSNTTNFDININGANYCSNVAVVYEGYIDISGSPFGDTRFFQINSTDGSLLYINDTLVVSNDGLHNYTGSPTAKVPLSYGLTARIKVSVHYFKGPDSEGTGLAVSWGRIFETYASPIAASEFKRNPCVGAQSGSPPVVKASPPPSKRSPPPHASQGRDAPPAHSPPRRPPPKNPTAPRKPPTHAPTHLPPKITSRKSLPKACGGKCGKPVRTLPKACGGKCGKPVHAPPKKTSRKALPKACGGKCATESPKKGL